MSPLNATLPLSRHSAAPAPCPPPAACWSARTADGPQRVGLFVDPTEAMIAAALASVRLDILQIYGAIGVLPDDKAAVRPADLARRRNQQRRRPADRRTRGRPAVAGGEAAGRCRTGQVETPQHSTGDCSAAGRPLPPGSLPADLRPKTSQPRSAKRGAGAVDVSSGVESRQGRQGLRPNPCLHRRREAFPALTGLLLGDLQFLSQPIDLRAQRLDLRPMHIGWIGRSAPR